MRSLSSTFTLTVLALALAAGSLRAGNPVPLFDGETLQGWDGDTRYWSVVNGSIRGANNGQVVSSTYLFTQKSYREFRMRLEVKQTISPEHSTMHSAVAALGERFEDKGDNAHGFKGPLLMFCHDWGIWDAYRRNRIEPANHRGTLKIKSEKKGEWNSIEILVIGNRIRFVNNGELVFDFTDKPEMLKASPLGLQLHSNGKPQEFFFRNITIEEKPGDKLLTLKPAKQAHMEALDEWLALARDKRAPIGDQDFAKAALSAKDAKEAGQLLWRDNMEHIRESRADEMKAKVITHGDQKMRFEFRKFGDQPKNGHCLYISMHGGGGTTARVNDQQWRNQLGLYKPEEGIYLAPRAPTDAWNLWHQGHIDRMFDRLIANMIVFEGVDPNRVYLMGYSAGGDGVYQLAPRMSDRFAAASMMAGHPNESQPQGLRNLPFMLWMGEKDSAYNRNKVAIQWGERLDALQKDDPGGYIHETEIVIGAGHWMNGQDAAAVPWMAKHTRNPLPERIVWRQDNETHLRFYWLGVDDQNRRGGSEVTVARKGQEIEIIKAGGVNSLIFYLNDDMANLDQPVKVRMGDKTLYEGKLNRTIAELAASLEQRADPNYLFSATVSVAVSD